MVVPLTNEVTPKFVGESMHLVLDSSGRDRLDVAGSTGVAQGYEEKEEEEEEEERLRLPLQVSSSSCLCLGMKV
jgi:hypothetical protein